MSPSLLKLTGKCCLLALLMIIMHKSQAQTGSGIVLRKVLDGANGQLTKDAAVTVQDSIYFDATLRSRLDTPYPVRNIITFGINEYSNVYLPATFTASVNIRLYYTRPDLTVDSADQQLTINYDSANAYTARNSFVFNNAHQVKVKVLSLAIPDRALPALVLENAMELHLRYKLSCTEDAIRSIKSNNPPNTDSTDELIVEWPAVTGADVYDLEWAYVDSAALNAGRYGSPANPQLIFANNTTRVTIPGNNYAIPLLYDDSGVLYFRVRAVQEKHNNIRLETAWSSDYSGGLGAFGFCGHQRNLNWQSTISFAEDGKRKVQVQYYDGSLRSRQTVTKDNTTNTTIVAESFYDYQGRPAVQVMPAPTIDNVLKYTRNLNPAMNNGEYDKNQYDYIEKPIDYVAASAKPMSTSSGANRYYSAANPAKDTGMNRYIPDAGGYAFTETQYTQDNTGRIARQSGVGPTFKLGSNHETKYFYGSPSQEDLDALFGTEAGDKTHYFKNMVADANGQYAVSYLDMQGRTVATALAGSPENTSLEDVPHQQAIQVTDSLSGPGRNTVKGLQLESKQSQLVIQDGYYKFEYVLAPPVLRKKDCNGNTLCYNGLYDLQIRITDDVYNYNLGGQPFDTLVRNYKADTIIANCDKPDSIKVKFELFLRKGNYEITKILSVSKEAMDYYRDSVFLKTSLCTSLEKEIEEQRKKQRDITCYPDCQTCKDSIGDWNTFRVDYVREAGHPIADTAAYRGEAWHAYQSALEACRDLCGELTEADETRTVMLLDVSAPSGQYANVANSSYMYSIFYQPNENAIPPYRRDDIVYLDEAGKPDMVYDESTQTYVKPQQLTPEQFADQFKPSWAEALLKFHPEYCKLQQYQQHAASHTWDRAFEATDTYAEAKQKGYLNPTGNSAIPFPIGSRDPLSLENNTRRDELNARLGNYKDGRSLWSISTILVKCSGTDAGCPGLYATPAQAFNESTLCSGDLDMAWRSFRQLYLDMKKEIIYGLLNTACATPGSKQLADAGKQPRFNNATDALAQNGLGNLTNPSQTPQDVQNTANTAMDQMIEENCRAYIPYWKQTLSSCYNQAALDNDIIPKLLAVCKEGADLDHPRGSSTVKPSSTYPYRSFDAVISEYNSQHGITDPLRCNAQLITSPRPYGKEPVYYNKNSYTKPTDCECEKLNDLNREYLAAKKPTDLNLSIYLRRTRNINISQTDLNVLMDACNAPAGSCTWLPKPIAIPAIMQCNTAAACVSCEEVNNLYARFKTTYPGVQPAVGEVDSTQFLKNELFARYMNNNLGFSKQAWEYLSFIDSCRLAPLQPVVQVCKPGGPQSKQMVKSYDNKGTDVITDIRRTADNGYIMTGSTTGNSQGGKDGYVIKTDATGALVWSKTYGAEQDDEFVRLMPTTDGGYIAIGNTRSYCYDPGAILIVKLDRDGVVTWNKVVDFGLEFAAKGSDIIQTTEGQYAFAGLRGSTATPGRFSDWIIGSLTDIGDLVWMKQIGSAYQQKERINLVEDNDILVAASSINDGPDYNNFDAVTLKLHKPDGAVMDMAQYDLESRNNITNGILKTGNGYKLAIVSLSDGGNPANNGALMDIARSGDVASARKINNAGNLDPNTWTVNAAADGSLFASQSASGSLQDVYWHKLRPDNSVEWSSHVRISGSDRLYRIVSNPDGTLAGAGMFNNLSMLMLATAAGRTGCSDTLATITDADITGACVRKSVPAQSDIPLGTNYISTVALTEVSSNPNGSIVSCPGLDSCYFAGGRMLCGNAAPVFAGVEIDDISNCSDSTYFAASAGSVIYNAYRDSVINDFEHDYIYTALQADIFEQFAVTYRTSEYHYTLYYYDQAGNLVKTVPPAGVVKDRSTEWIARVKAARKARQQLAPAHKLITQYRYNTLNQVVAQQTPDAGRSRFWYDRLGRLAVSQNAKQATANHYSYTLYDELGRITEVGEITSATPMTDLISRKASDLSQWINNAAATRTQITRTVYDQPYTPLAPVMKAANLRNRVSWTALYNTAADIAGGNHAAASFYSYDIHGNVDTLTQDFKLGAMAGASNRFKKIVYRYDLISGKVNQVAYQPGQPDAFYHRYSYDAENRITNVETSRDSVYWENDAFYQYYKHGPLARMVLGQQQVQGIDYAYTLQGWIKGVNSTALTPTADMGQDGAAGSLTAKDAFGYALHYYGKDDYKTVNSSVRPFADADGTGSVFRPLYNGNIAAMSVNLPKVGTPLFYSYRYDALNRLVSMETQHGFNAANNTWQPVSVPDFGERISYDPNGNILAYRRNGNSTWAGKPIDMDKLAYQYQPGTNRLSAIKDTVPAGNYSNDIDDQAADNYTYDAIGNMVKDNKEGISNIEWTVYGKISKITKTDGTVIAYTYDVAGNRISKTVGGKQTWYVRDASGNVMSVYTSGDNAVNGGNLTQTETHLYGSSRLGMSTLATNVQRPVIPSTTNLLGLGTGINITFTRGSKLFELSNHLGNVLATVSDAKASVSAGGNTVDYYGPQLVSAQDYYPFGMLQQGRNWNADGYRYGFNGKESDSEVKGVGVNLDFGGRVYDSRIGKWLSVDPLQSKYPGESPYMFSGNSPMLFNDPDGKEKVVTIYVKTNSGTYKLMQVVDKKYFLASLDQGYYGIHGFQKHSVYQDITIDFSTGAKTPYSMDEHWVTSSASFAEYAKIKWNRAFGEFDEPRVQPFGYVLSGNSSGDAFDFVSDAGIKEHIDFGNVLNASAAWRDLAVGDGIGNLMDYINDLKEVLKKDSKLLDGLMNALERVDSYMDAMDAANIDPSLNDPALIYAGDSAKCPACNQRSDSKHIDEVNGKGAFEKLRSEGKTDKTKKK